MVGFIQHRVNALAAAQTLPPELGAEIDLRADINRRHRICLQHDAWVVDGSNRMQTGDDLSAYLDVWRQTPRGLLVLNTKEDGLEEQALAALEARAISEFVFLDTSLPTMVRLSNRGLGNHLALRLSSMEPAGGLLPWLALAPPKRPRYLWVDCFGHTPLPASALEPLTSYVQPILVSPDLQGDLPLDTLDSFLELGRLCRFICTKQPDRWRQALSSLA